MKGAFTPCGLLHPRSGITETSALSPIKASTAPRPIPTMHGSYSASHTHIKVWKSSKSRVAIDVETLASLWGYSICHWAAPTQIFATDNGPRFNAAESKRRGCAADRHKLRNGSAIWEELRAELAEQVHNTVENTYPACALSRRVL